jgi:hypothetical protein
MIGHIKSRSTIGKILPGLYGLPPRNSASDALALQHQFGGWRAADVAAAKGLRCSPVAVAVRRWH